MSDHLPLRRPSDLVREAGRRQLASEAPTRAWPEGFAASREDRAALHLLLRLASLTADRLLDLAQSKPTAAACLAQVATGRAGSDTDRLLASAEDPSAHVEAVRACGARLVAVGDADYPVELFDLYDPPAGFFVRGHPLLPDQPRVAVVGARNCSADGREVAQAVGRGLAEAGVCVVSGVARGIDGAAHRGALASPPPPVGVATLAVLGSGIDTTYPPSNRGLLERIAVEGTVVSEYPPGTPAEPFRFPARNRIIAALSRGVVVVEGARGSGSLITAEHALDLGRDVFAVPGPVFSELAAAPLELIRDGATLIRGPDDLLDDLRLGGVGAPPGAGAAPERIPDSARRVWEALAAPASADAIAAAISAPLPAVLASLVDLELAGLVVQSGGRYRRRVAVARG